MAAHIQEHHLVITGFGGNDTLRSFCLYVHMKLSEKSENSLICSSTNHLAPVYGPTFFLCKL